MLALPMESLAFYHERSVFPGSGKANCQNCQTVTAGLRGELCFRVNSTVFLREDLLNAPAEIGK